MQASSQPVQGPTTRLPILATAVIPWTKDYDFDEPAFRREVHTIAHGLTRYIYIFGTAGEGYAVSERQFDEIARSFWSAAQECGAVPMLGVISLSLRTIIERIERGRLLGFRKFQLSLPSWGALSDAEVDQFFAETCGRFPDLEFHQYNLLRTKRLLTSREYLRLAKAHPNFIGVKSGASDPAVVQDLLTAAPRVAFYFTEIGYALARRTHDVGLLASLSTINYSRAKAFVAGDDARREADLAELRPILKQLLGQAEGRFHMDGAFDKILFRMVEPTFPLRLLPPYATATEEDVIQFRDALPLDWRHRNPV